MKKVLCAVLALTMILALAACGGNESKETTAAPDWVVELLGHEPTGRLKELYDKGEIEMVTSPDWPPIEFTDPSKSGDEKYVGSDMSFARYLAEEMGLKLVINANDFESCLTMISEDLCDLGISGFTPDADRMLLMDFSDNYYVSSYQGILVRDEDAANYTSYESFAGKTVAAQNGSIQQALAEEYLVPAGAKLQLVTKVTDGLTMLEAGTIDGLVMEADPGEAAALIKPALEMCEVHLNTEEMGFACAIPKGEEGYNDDYLKVLNHLIAKVVEEGKYLEWREEALQLQVEMGEVNFD